MVGIAGSRRRQQTSTFRLVRPGRIVDLPLVSVRPLIPLAEYVRARLSALGERFDETSGHTADPAVRTGIAGSTADLGPRLWPTMTSRARQQLAKRLAHLLQS